MHQLRGPVAKDMNLWKKDIWLTLANHTFDPHKTYHLIVRDTEDQLDLFEATQAVLEAQGFELGALPTVVSRAEAEGFFGFTPDCAAGVRSATRTPIPRAHE